MLNLRSSRFIFSGFILLVSFFVQSIYAEAEDIIIYGANAYGQQDLVEINISQNTAMQLADLAFPTQGIDQDPSTGLIYYFDFYDTGADAFAAYDPLLGQNEIVKDYGLYPGFFIKCMAFAPDGTLYIISNDDQFMSIDKQTGETTFLGFVEGLEQGPLGRTGDIAFAPDGTLYIATYKNLYTIDLDTLQATLLFSNMLPDQSEIKVWSGLAYHDGMLYASDIESVVGGEYEYKSSIYSIDPTNGSVVKLLDSPIFLNDLTAINSVTPNLNSAPVIESIGDKAVNEGATLDFIVTANDSNPTDSLFFSVDNLPSGASFNSSTGDFSWTPGAVDVGYHKLVFSVTDNGNPPLSDVEEIIIEVNPASASSVIIELNGQGDTEDTAIGSSAGSLLNYGGAPTTLAIGLNSVTARSLIRWDLSSIPAGSTILSAQMSLYSYSYYGSSSSPTINAHRLLVPWIEGSLDAQDRQIDNPDSACWIESGNGIEWEIQGADGVTDRDATIISTAAHQGNGWFDWNIKTAVQNWIDGTWENNGLLLKANSESTTNMRLFVASEYQNSTYRPKLVIEYVVGTVPGNYPPIIEPIETKVVNVGVPLTFSIAASDYNPGDTLTYMVENLPVGASFNTDTKEFSWTPGASDIGSHTIIFSVTDDAIPPLSASEEVTINVNPAVPQSTIRELMGTSASEDTAIGNGALANLNYGGAPTTIAIGVNGFTARSLIRWDLSGIPAGSTIIDAQLLLYGHTHYGSSTTTINVYRLMKPWVEGTLNAQDRQLDNPDSASWNEYGNGTTWQTPGADGPSDRSESLISKATHQGNGWYSWDLRGAVQNWLNGSWPNEGLLLKAANEDSTNLRVFVSSEYSDDSFIPMLVIEYIAP